MPNGTFFNGSTNYVESTTGTDLTLGAFTACMVGFININTGSQSVITLGTGGSTVGFSFVFTDALGSPLWIVGISAATFVTGPVPATGDQAVWVTKGTGSVIPRFHVFNGTTWSHTAASGALANASGVIDQIRVGADLSGAGGFNGELSMAGIWNEDTTDGNIEKLRDYGEVLNKANRQFLTGTSLIGAKTMDDISTNNNDETARVGLLPGSRSTPNFFKNFPPLAPQPARLAGPDSSGPLAWQWVQASGVDATVVTPDSYFPPWPPQQPPHWGM